MNRRQQRKHKVFDLKNLRVADGTERELLFVAVNLHGNRFGTLHTAAVLHDLARNIVSGGLPEKLPEGALDSGLDVLSGIYGATELLGRALEISPEIPEKHLDLFECLALIRDRVEQLSQAMLAKAGRGPVS